MAINNLTEYEQEKIEVEFAKVANQLSEGHWKGNLPKARKLIVADAVTKDPDEPALYWVKSEDNARTYQVYLGIDENGCSCADAKNRGKYCKHYVAAEFYKRLNQRGGKMEKAAPKQTNQPAKQNDPVKQAEEESSRECLEAYESTPKEYHRFITLIQQNKKVGGSRQNPIYASIKKPYMRVEGRVKMAIQDGEISVKTEPIDIFGKPAIRATVTTPRGSATGTSEIRFGGSGVDSTNPIENAETSAVGRALGNLDYGTLGGIASAEEVQQAIEQQTRPVGEREVRRAENDAEHASIDRDKIRKEIWGYVQTVAEEDRPEFFTRFFACKPEKLKDMPDHTLVELWERAQEEITIS